MITSRNKCFSFAFKSISWLLHWIMSNHNDDHYYMNCVHLFTTESKIKSHQNMCKNHDYCNMKLSDALKKKYWRIHRIIFQKLNVCKKKVHMRTNTYCDNVLTKSFTSKINKHDHCSYSLFTDCSFDNNKSKHNFYRSRDSMIKFCADLKYHAT